MSSIETPGPSTSVTSGPGLGAAKRGVTSTISGLGGKISDLFSGGRKGIIQSKTDKPTGRDIQPQYKWDEKVEQRLLGLADYYYREGSFEKIQFARKWMRN